MTAYRRFTDSENAEIWDQTEAGECVRAVAFTFGHFPGRCAGHGPTQGWDVALWPGDAASWPCRPGRGKRSPGVWQPGSPFGRSQRS
jgi:hypothetical protein